ncbi:MAG: hypothetical protein KBT03_09725 [Bacteroidales bacterium]|nr:hypothetical protein [Candidatus Scybalousia scybalohippi]
MNKMVAIKQGNKTIYRIIDENKKDDGCDDKYYGDMTTTARNKIDYFDVPQERWDKVFPKK